MTALGVETALSLAIVALLIDAYLMPPRGWVGGPGHQLFCTLLFCSALVLFSVNFFYWLDGVIRR